MLQPVDKAEVSQLSPNASIEHEFRFGDLSGDWRRQSWMLPSALVQLRLLLTAVAVAACSLMLTLGWTTRVHQFALIWPVTGALMVMMLPRWNLPLRARLLMLAGGACGVAGGGLAVGMPGWLAVQTAALTTVDVCLASLMLLPGVDCFNSLRNRSGVVRFVTTAVVVPLCTAAMGAPSLSLFLHETAMRTALEAFFSNSLGMALVYPFGLMLCTAPTGELRTLLLRFRPQVALGFLALVTGAVFWQNAGPFLFVVFPPMIAVLMALGLEGAMLTSLLMCGIGWFATAHGHGPIWLLRNATPEYRMLVLQIFEWTCLVTAMPVGALLDERRVAERKADEGRAIYQTMLCNAEEMIVLSSLDSTQRYVSPSVERLTGYTPAEYLTMDRLATFHPEDRDFAATLLKSMNGGKWEHTLRYRALQKNGGYKWAEATIRAYGDKATGTVKGYVAAIRDISEQRKTESRWAEERAALAQEQTRLSTLATTDALTGLPNRRAFEELLCVQEFDMQRQAERVLAMQGARTVGLRKLTIMMVDVDFFKLYNDTYGHAAGDSCLQELAGILRSTLSRKDDVVARLGGEEFAIVLPGAGNTAAMRVAERLLNAVRAAKRPHSGSPLGHVTISIGVAVGMPARDFSYALLLQQADRALYLCKGDGKNQAKLHAGLI